MTSTDTVRAIQFAAIDQVEAVTVRQDDDWGAGEALIAPLRIGICGSDLHVLHGHHPFVKPPLIAGHECVARVLAVADDIDQTLVGRHVLVNPLVAPTEQSDWRGEANVQETAMVMGFKLPGLARTRAVVPAVQLHALPRSADLTAAVLAEPLAAGRHAAKRPHGRLEEVLIIGGGPIGLSVLVGLRAEGAGHVTLIEPVASKRELAIRLGADVVAAPDDASLPAAHFTAVFDCVASPATIRQSVDITRAGGAVVVMGVPTGESWNLPLPRMQRFEIDLLGSGMYTGTDIDTAIDAISAAPDTALQMVSRVAPMSEIAEAFSTASLPESVKTVIALDTPDS